MREIKFRAWDKENKKMVYVPALNLELQEPILNFGEEYHERPEGEFELMQYTGLKDKNGKEIFESDRLVSEKGVGKIVVWSKNFGKWSLQYPNRWNNKGNLLYQGLTVELAEKHEVIGNVFENKDLLIL